jgi:hypothetical protein
VTACSAKNLAHALPPLVIFALFTNAQIVPETSNGHLRRIRLRIVFGEWGDGQQTALV